MPLLSWYPRWFAKDAPLPHPIKWSRILRDRQDNLHQRRLIIIKKKIMRDGELAQRVKVLALKHAEILTYATMSINLQDIMLNGISQTENDKYCIFSITPSRLLQSNMLVARNLVLSCGQLLY